MKLGDGLLLRAAPPAAAVIIRILHALNRTEILGEENPRAFWDRQEPLLFAFWHDQLLLMVKAYHGPGLKILISASKDGELIARTMACFGQGAVRGSSSRQGRAALRQMLQLTREKVDLAITPDGPKGPRHRVKPGIVHLARHSGRPVIPVAFACSRGHRFASWDRFLLPYPFGRGVFSFGEPVAFSPEEEEAVSLERLQAAMDKNVRRVEARLEELGVSAV